MTAQGPAWYGRAFAPSDGVTTTAPLPARRRTGMDRPNCVRSSNLGAERHEAVSRRGRAQEAQHFRVARNRARKSKQAERRKERKDHEKADAYDQIGSNYFNLNNYSEGLSNLDKSINIYKSILKKRKFSTYEAWVYCLSYLFKGSSLENLNRYDEAIETYTTGKKVIEKYKNEEFYQDLINGFNEGLSSCYKKLVK